MEGSGSSTDPPFVSSHPLDGVPTQLPRAVIKSEGLFSPGLVCSPDPCSKAGVDQDASIALSCLGATKSN